MKSTYGKKNVTTSHMGTALPLKLVLLMNIQGNFPLKYPLGPLQQNLKAKHSYEELILFNNLGHQTYPSYYW